MPCIERTSPGKAGHAAHVVPYKHGPALGLHIAGGDRGGRLRRAGAASTVVYAHYRLEHVTATGRTWPLARVSDEARQVA